MSDADIYNEGHAQGVIDAQRRHCRHDDPWMRLLWVSEVQPTEPNPYEGGCCDETCTEAHP